MTAGIAAARPEVGLLSPTGFYDACVKFQDISEACESTLFTSHIFGQVRASLLALKLLDS